VERSRSSGDAEFNIREWNVERDYSSRTGAGLNIDGAAE